jgi:hypothetical protein
MPFLAWRITITLFALYEANFYKIKGREILSRSHNYLNTTDGNVRLRASPQPLRCSVHAWEFKIFVFEIYFDF